MVVAFSLWTIMMPSPDPTPKPAKSTKFRQNYRNPSNTFYRCSPRAQKLPMHGCKTNHSKGTGDPEKNSRALKRI